jgi:SNF family Na+-dependent transporter
LGQPFIAFLKDELRISHKKTITILLIATFILVQPVIFFLAKGFLDELDFWAGTLLFVVFSLIEAILGCWIFGIDNIWKELTRGAKIRVPRIFYYIMKYVTPAYLLIVLVVWTYQKAIDVFLLKNVSDENVPYVLAARFLLVALFLIFAVLVHKVWKRNREEELFEV